MDEVRVLIVADDPLARAGLATLLSQQPGCTVTGQVDGNTDLPAALRVYRADVVVWDLGWDPTRSLERLGDQQDAQLPIVALLPDETHAVATWAAGAHGLFLRDVGAASLLAALVAVGQGLIVLEPALASALLADRVRTPEPVAAEFTPRELEVLQLLAEGLPNKAIAAQLSISEHTVKFHVNAILSKLGAQSRTEAVVRATRRGLVLL